MCRVLLVIPLPAVKRQRVGAAFRIEGCAAVPIVNPRLSCRRRIRRCR